MNDNCFELLAFNLTCRDMIAADAALSFPEERLAGYALGLYESDPDQKAFVEKEIFKNQHLSSRLASVRNYLEFYDLTTLEAYYQQVQDDDVQAKLMEQKTDMMAGLSSEEGVAHHLHAFWDDEASVDPWVYAVKEMGSFGVA